MNGEVVGRKEGGEVVGRKEGDGKSLVSACLTNCAARWPPQYAPAPADLDF